MDTVEKREYQPEVDQTPVDDGDGGRLYNWRIRNSAGTVVAQGLLSPQEAQRRAVYYAWAGISAPPRAARYDDAITSAMNHLGNFSQGTALPFMAEWGQRPFWTQVDLLGPDLKRWLAEHYRPEACAVCGGPGTMSASLGPACPEHYDELSDSN